MTLPWLTRPATRHDAATIAQHRFFNPQEDPADLASYAQWVDIRIGAGSYIGSMAEVNGEAIGGAGATLLDWGPTRGGRGPIKARIVNVYTTPSWRGRGVSRCLVEDVLARCQALGIDDFCLSHTEASKHLYTSLGFVISEVEMFRRGDEAGTGTPGAQGAQRGTTEHGPTGLPGTMATWFPGPERTPDGLNYLCRECGKAYSVDLPFCDNCGAWPGQSG
jgi:GNAT superfamily N-acetyltransferase